MNKTTTKVVAIATTPLKAVPALLLEAQAIKIANTDDMLVAAEVLSRLNKVSDALTKEKEKLTKPLNATLKEIRGRYKPAEEQLDSAIGAIRQEMSAYQTAAILKSEAQAHKIAARVGEGRGKLTAETAVRKLGEIDTPLEQVAVDSGSVEFRAQKKLVVDDASALLVWLAQNRPELLSYSDRPVIDIINSGTTVEGAHLEEVQVPINRR